MSNRLEQAIPGDARATRRGEGGHTHPMLVVSVDIEDWYHLPPITGLPSSKFRDVDQFFGEWNSRYDYLSEPTDRVLNMLSDLRIKATFFVVADVVRRYPGLVQRIAGMGHEIACHGLHHACKIDPKTKKPMMTRKEFEQRTLTARGLLEDAVGRKVTGYRAPCAYVAGWMLDVLEEMGFRYDSSVSANSIYNKTDSRLKGVDTRPYYPQKGTLEPGEKKRGIIEFPLAALNVAGFKFPTHGGPLLRFSGATFTSLGLKQSMKRGDTTFIFHPIDICRESFPLNTSFTQRLFWAIRGETVQRRIRRILTHVSPSMGTCGELINSFDKTIVTTS